MSNWDPNRRNETLSTPKLDNMKCSNQSWVLDIETRTKKWDTQYRIFFKLGIIILGYFTGPSPFHKDLSGSCVKAVAMNKGWIREMEPVLHFGQPSAWLSLPSSEIKDLEQNFAAFYQEKQWDWWDSHMWVTVTFSTPVQPCKTHTHKWKGLFKCGRV